MSKIDIQINKAKIASYNVDLHDDETMPDVTAQIELFSGEQAVSKFTLTTKAWYGDAVKFEIPANLIDPIVSISKQLETILVRECNKQFKQLPAGTVVIEDES